MDWAVLTYSRAASTPTPSVKSKTAAVDEDVRGTERPSQRLAGRVPAEGDDPGRAQASGSNDGALTHRPVPDDGDHAAGTDAGAHRHMVGPVHMTSESVSSERMISSE